MGDLDTTEALIRAAWAHHAPSCWMGDEALRIEFDGTEYTVGFVYDGVDDCRHLSWRTTGAHVSQSAPTLAEALARFQAQWASPAEAD